VSLPCAVEIREGSAPTPLRITVLSPFGAWVETAQPLAPGASLRVAFAIPGVETETPALRFVARVTWTAAPGELDAGDPGGMGLAFEASEAERTRLDAALEALPEARMTFDACAEEHDVLWTALPAIDAPGREALAPVPGAAAEAALAEADAALLVDLDSWFLETRPATPTETTEVLRLSPVAPSAPRAVEEPRWVRGSNAVRLSLTLTSY
jgi:hypothetical protein